EEQTLQRMTSWDTLYRQLRNALPYNLYHNGKRLTSFEQYKDYVVAEFEDGHSERCDLLVGADGPSSIVRQQLLHDVYPKYAGYVAWRGVVDENKVPIDIVQFFADKFTFFHGRNTQILCYLIPGPTGELSEGERRLNWVWYVNVSVGNKLQSLLTDRYGKQRVFRTTRNGQRRFCTTTKKHRRKSLGSSLYKPMSLSYKQYMICLYLEWHLGEFVYWEMLHLFLVHIQLRGFPRRLQML
ncbi:MAG TPA: FAD-dependent monooxygenase, partial [Methylomirabilota bacterium]|nr:FAD-dependent monooxygenase [Methylomirabilota bacterium]